MQYARENLYILIHTFHTYTNIVYTVDVYVIIYICIHVCVHVFAFTDVVRDVVPWASKA